MKNSLLLKSALLTLSLGLIIFSSNGQESSEHNHSRFIWKPSLESNFMGFSHSWKLSSEIVNMSNCGHDHSTLDNMPAMPDLDLTIHIKCENPSFKFLVSNADNIPLDNLTGITVEVASAGQVNQTIMEAVRLEGLWAIDLSQFQGKDIQIKFLISNPSLFINYTLEYE